jgi:tetratricopeptide (TPR) repeat protein
MIGARFRLPEWSGFRPMMVVLLAIAPSLALGQDEPAKPASAKTVQPALQLLTEANITPLTIQVEPFVAWVKPIFNGVEARFRLEKARRDLAIQITLRKNGESEIVVAGRPALSDEEKKDLLALVDLGKAPRPKVVDFSFRILVKVNGGDPDANREYEPKLVDPFEAFRDKFAQATTAEQVALLRTWAREQAIPVLAAAASKADPRYEGVVNFGQTLAKLDLSQTLDVEALTERNHDYWRAMLEMAPGNMLVPVSRLTLHASNGELAKANRMAEIARYFDANQSAPSRLLGEFRELYAIFSKPFEARVSQGIALHDQGKFDQAIAIYEEALRDYPASPWATYELFHSQRTLLTQQKKSVDEAHAGWPEAKAAILAHDPLYPSMALAKGREDAFQVLRRAEINKLFKDRSKTQSDMLAYADIARDLGQYGYSSTIYWYAVTRFKPEDTANRDLIEDFLFGVERLGIKDLKENFKGDHEAAFARIEADRKKRKDEGPASKFTADPEPEIGKKPKKPDASGPEKR